MEFLARIIVWINIPVNAIGKLFLSPLCGLPGWLSNTIISAFAGILLLVIFKYTSNQQAIGRVRDKVNAHLLSLRLFKDSISATLKAQQQIFKGAMLLLFYAVKPMLFMIVPVALMLAQMGLVYQYRPLVPGEEAVVTMKLKVGPDNLMPDVSIESMPAKVVTGPVRILSRSEICWKIRAEKAGRSLIKFKVADIHVTKELAVGEGFMRVSPERPAWNWGDIILYPQEKPFEPDSVVQSINIVYPEQSSWSLLGIPFWLFFFFIVSMVFALIFKPFLNVRI